MRPFASWRSASRASWRAAKDARSEAGAAAAARGDGVVEAAQLPEGEGEAVPRDCEPGLLLDRLAEERDRLVAAVVREVIEAAAVERVRLRRPAHRALGECALRPRRLVALRRETERAARATQEHAHLARGLEVAGGLRDGRACLEDARRLGGLARGEQRAAEITLRGRIGGIEREGAAQRVLRLFVPAELEQCPTEREPAQLVVGIAREEPAQARDPLLERLSAAGRHAGDPTPARLQLPLSGDPSMPPLDDIVTAARRFLLSRLFRNLAAGLGLMQALVAHWTAVLFGAPSAGRALPWLLLALVLAVANVMLVPGMMRRRGKSDALSRALRRYVELGVATLLLGTAVVACWLVLAPVVALPYALGLYDFDTAAWLFRAASGLFVGAVAVSVAWSLTAGQARVAYTRVRVELPGLEQRLAGLRVVQISDLHIGNQLEGERLARMVERVNETEPDLVAITGDLFHDDPRHLPEARHLGALRARFGVFAILGNHDANVGADRVAEAIAEHAPSVRLLRDELVRLPSAEPLYLAGVEDLGGPFFERSLHVPAIDALADLRPSDGPVVLLVHHPEMFEHAARRGFPLVLAGHTHGGQIALPVGRRSVNLARVMTPLTRGIYQIESSLLYVNRGIGVGGPAVRIHCNREIAVFELEPA